MNLTDQRGQRREPDSPLRGQCGGVRGMVVTLVVLIGAFGLGSLPALAISAVRKQNKRHWWA